MAKWLLNQIYRVSNNNNTISWASFYLTFTIDSFWSLMVIWLSPQSAHLWLLSTVCVCVGGRSLYVTPTFFSWSPIHTPWMVLVLAPLSFIIASVDSNTDISSLSVCLPSLHNAPALCQVLHHVYHTPFLIYMFFLYYWHTYLQLL